LQEIRAASVPSRNGLWHSNRERDAAMAESLYWTVAEHLCAAHRGFATGHGAKNFAYRFYRCRWQIELFFKSLQQNLPLGSFPGYNANAVRWQIWMGLLVHWRMRFLKWKAQWPSHFGRLFVLVRCTLWPRWDLARCLEFYGTAGSRRRMRLNLRQAYLPGFM
jgi:hypothetical protein